MRRGWGVVKIVWVLGSTEQLLGVGPLDEAIGATSMIGPFNL